MIIGNAMTEPSSKTVSTQKSRKRNAAFHVSRITAAIRLPNRTLTRVSNMIRCRSGHFGLFKREESFSLAFDKSTGLAGSGAGAGVGAGVGSADLVRDSSFLASTDGCGSTGSAFGGGADWGNVSFSSTLLWAATGSSPRKYSATFAPEVAPEVSAELAFARST